MKHPCLGCSEPSECMSTSYWRENNRQNLFCVYGDCTPKSRLLWAISSHLLLATSGWLSRFLFCGFRSEDGRLNTTRSVLHSRESTSSPLSSCRSIEERDENPGMWWGQQGLHPRVIGWEGIPNISKGLSKRFVLGECKGINDLAFLVPFQIKAIHFPANPSKAPTASGPVIGTVDTARSKSELGSANDQGKFWQEMETSRLM